MGGDPSTLRSSPFDPAAERTSGLFGTARIGRPRMTASCTVSSDPPLSPDSTTTTSWATWATIRFRDGKASGRGPRCGSYSLSRSPSTATLLCKLRCSRGYTTPRPVPRTAIARPSPSESTVPRWAAPSIPRASPETTAIPATDNDAPSSRAKARPAADAERVPTIATRGRSNASSDPAYASAAGGSSSVPNTVAQPGSSASHQRHWATRTPPSHSAANRAASWSHPSPRRRSEGKGEASPRERRSRVSPRPSTECRCTDRSRETPSPAQDRKVSMSASCRRRTSFNAVWSQSVVMPRRHSLHRAGPDGGVRGRGRRRRCRERTRCHRREGRPACERPGEPGRDRAP